MLKQTKKHTVYEVWNEYVAESVFIDHKPTKTEVKELIEKNEWFKKWKDVTLSEFIRKHIIVERLEHFYITDPRHVKCGHP
jgi:hypothetical protein